MKHKKTLKIILSGAVILSMSLLAFTPIAAYAQSDDEPSDNPKPPVDGEGIKRLLKGVAVRTFRYQKSMVNYFALSLEFSDSATERAKMRIAKLEEDNRDVSGLEFALEQFNDLIAEAQTAQVKANRLVVLHPGFDESGRAIDLDLARKTIQELEPLIQTIRENLVESFRIIFEAIKEFGDRNDIL